MPSVLGRAAELLGARRNSEALALLTAHEDAGRADAQYCTARAKAHRALGQMAEAARWYDAALSHQPHTSAALHGRARVALQRGEAEALQRFDAALAVNPGDADLWLGKAQALDVAGDSKGARLIAQQLCDQAPGFIAALEFLAGLNLAQGVVDFAAPFAVATLKAPQDPNIAAAHVDALAGIDRAAEAAAVAAEARRRFPALTHFALLEAVHAGSAGEWERAEAIFAALPKETPQRALHEARHRIRSGEIRRACALLDTALTESPWDIAAWAMAGIVWRLSDEERHRAKAEWLHGQPGLIQFRPLSARAGLIKDVTAELGRLHQRSGMPLGQSLRGGTQTRGILFQRTELLLAELHDAIRATLEEYRADLPPLDEAHPLLRHRDAPWQLAGSWSVRLTGAGDHHAAHIHPQGLISSALYLVVPGEVDEAGHPGCLEIGRPKADLCTDLAPLRIIKPEPGHLALFPSTAYHGTTPFRAAERMTVAFDVVCDEVKESEPTPNP
ncbi:putative 2OG-Fe(II) oxygenase [Qipengyuania sp. ASV99]|uniref:putative 2OG-Fe(II) oxygenase n=1 Tax=Qipengyuania sp. ASV99 TaxID=3399681 RepID=UPI003A4C833D